MPSYPVPDDNPKCQCRGNPMMAFFCQFGHMLECHYPYSCSEAGCSHLTKYDYELDDVLQMQEDAKRRIEASELPPYTLDEHGNAVVKVEDE